MKLIRFMSAAEAILLLQGRRLQNKTVHNQGEWKSSTSVGFCFAIAENLPIRQEIYYASQRLSGITDMHVCLVAELPDGPSIHFRETSGKYSGGTFPELCTTKYKLDDFLTWAMFAPTNIKGTMPIFSGNWVNPKLITKAEK